MFHIFERGLRHLAAAHFRLKDQVSYDSLKPMEIMKLTLWNPIVLVLGIAGIASPASADENSSATNRWPPALTAQQFVSDAAVGGAKEVLLSEVALARSTNADIKSFAKRIVKDHRAANQKLATIAETKGLNIPPTNTFSADDPNWSDARIANPDNLKGAQLLNLKELPYLADYLAVKQLRTLSGEHFDQAYLSAMASDHAQTVSEFETAAQKLTDPELKKFATKTLPTLHRHLRMAQELNGKYCGPNGMAVTNLPSPTVLPLEPPM